MPIVQRPDGADIAYEVEGRGPPAVFVHGLTSAGHSWKPVTDRLVGEVTCVRLDLCGHGLSSRAEDYSTPSLVADVRAVVDELGIGDHAIVGHSLGVTIAALYGAMHGARGIVCVDSSLRFGDFAEFVRPWAGSLCGDDTLQALLEIDRALGLEPYAQTAEMERRILAFPGEVVRGVWATLLTTPPRELTATAEAFLPRIKAPLLSLHGSSPPHDYEAWLTRLVPSASVEVWAGAGHMLHLVDPARFAARIRPILIGA